MQQANKKTLKYLLRERERERERESKQNFTQNCWRHESEFELKLFVWN